MPQIISMKCPECGATLELSDDRKIAFCSYCGAKIIIHNENEHIIRNIDEAAIKKAESERDVRLKELDVQEKDSNQRHFISVILLFLSIIIIGVGLYIRKTGIEKEGLESYYYMILGVVIAVFGALMIPFGLFNYFGFYTNYIKKPGYIQAPRTLENFSHMQYKTVRYELAKAGFTNISLVPQNDITYTFLDSLLKLESQNGKVDSIIINNQNMNFDFWYSPKSSVSIIYHSDNSIY